MLYLVLMTYSPSVDHPRSVYARKTLESTLANLRSSMHLKVHIASDGSDPLHIASLVDICQQHDIEPSISDSQRRGYGASYNLATHYVHNDGDYFLMLEDDWELTRTLDIDPLIAAMQDLQVNCIRMGYLSYTQKLSGWVRRTNGLTYLQLDADCAEPHVWSGHPRLESLGYQRAVGLWPEGVEPGVTEFTVAHYKAARQGVVWPMDLIKPYGDLFAHIGTVRSTEEVTLAQRSV
jgi:hypothetical protein